MKLDRHVWILCQRQKASFCKIHLEFWLEILWVASYARMVSVRWITYYKIFLPISPPAPFTVHLISQFPVDTNILRICTNIFMLKHTYDFGWRVDEGAIICKYSDLIYSNFQCLWHTRGWVEIYEHAIVFCHKTAAVDTSTVLSWTPAHETPNPEDIPKSHFFGPLQRNLCLMVVNFRSYISLVKPRFKRWWMAKISRSLVKSLKY